MPSLRRLLRFLELRNKRVDFSNTLSRCLKLKVLKIDTFYPASYLNSLQERDKHIISDYNYDEYYNWLINQRSYLSDYITYPMNLNGWDAREFISHDNILIKKLCVSGEIKFKQVDKLFYWIYRIFTAKIYQLFIWNEWKKILNTKDFYLQKYITTFNPDIIFLREPTQIDGRFFDRYKNKKFIISLIGCPFRHANNFNFLRSDLILTITKEYHDFFLTQGVESELIEYGIDERLVDEIGDCKKIYDCVFIGMLGSTDQSRKSELLEFIASKGKLKWWGLQGDKMHLYPNLISTYQGEVSGIEMYRIYKSAKIVINDYVNMANGANVNLRTKEVLSVGGFLLTRSENKSVYSDNKNFETFVNKDECLKKILYYLQNEDECVKIAQNGFKYARENWSYSKLIPVLMQRIIEVYDNWERVSLLQSEQTFIERKIYN